MRSPFRAPASTRRGACCLDAGRLRDLVDELAFAFDAQDEAGRCGDEVDDIGPRVGQKPRRLDGFRRHAAQLVERELASPMAARRLVDSVIEKAQLLADVPGAGTALRTLNGIDTGYRCMTSGSWMVFLECDNGRAFVVRVLYAKSDYMRTLFGEINSER